MKNVKFVFILVVFLVSLFLCASVPQVFSQEESGDDSVVTNEVRDSVGNTVVNAGTEDASADDENQEEKSNITGDNSANGDDSDQGEDKGEVKEDEEQPKPQSKNLYERRGRLPPVPRN